MNNRNAPPASLTLRLALAMLLLFAPLAPARADLGSDWLAAQFQADGSIAAEADIATAYQATAETLRLWQATGESGRSVVPAALQFLEADNYGGTEYLARLIVAKAEAGSATSDLTAELLPRANTDGGFGELQGYGGTALDTAFALAALHTSGQGSTQQAYGGVDFLLNARQPDGGWALDGNAADVYVTAQALLALLPYYNSFSDVPGAIAAAQNFLLSQRDAGGLWGEDYRSAVALIALKSSMTDGGSLQADIDALKNRQGPDGSWSGDVYATALALRLMALADNPVANPTLSALQGRVLDGDSGLPLAGVQVLLQGTSPVETVTDGGGYFLFGELPPGNYTATFSLADYAALVASTALSAGKITDLGDLNLLKTAVNPSTATIRGTTTDAATGLALQGVLITSGAQSAVTAADGSYQLNGVAPGSVTVSAQLSGYADASAQADLSAGTILLFSPQLTPGMSEGTQTGIYGVITDAETGLPLQGVAVSVTGAADMAANTDAAGAYNLEPLPAGGAAITAALPGYDTVSAQLTALEGVRYEFSPQLYLNGTMPPGANAAGVSGTVLDSVTGLPLPGVAVQATHGGTTETLSTDAAGRFEITSISDAEVTLNFSLAEYQPVQLVLPVEPLTAADIGQVRMRPQAVEALLPDLAAESLVEQNVATDAQSLEITGTLQATVKNRGTASAGSFVEVLAYYDADRDGNYNSAADTALGAAYLTAPLPAGGAESVSIPLAGTVAFRDAPVRVWVDSLQSVVESDEGNNQAATSDACQGEPLTTGALDPVVKWEWSSSSYQPSYNQAISTPVVAQLNDDNGDDLINSDDIPDVIFNTFSGSNYSGKGLLRAVSGKDGQEIWQNPATPNWVSGYHGPAVGDIDHDGLIEIVIGGELQKGLMAFENDGTLKWSVTVSGVAQPALADLDHDGQVEIVYGRRVFNADGGLRWTAAVDEKAPAIADLDMDGTLDVFVGGSAYNHDGTLKWKSKIVSVWNGMGNFDDDPYPEIAVKTGALSGAAVYLLEHTGEIKWGPVTVPGGGGGALTIGDFDGDGQAEIGIAGKSNYVVFETDGSIKWTKTVQDYTSYSTGSSVFDFEGDGKAEVLYGDELKFRIFNGSTGNVLFETSNPSGTAYEYPVIADIDNDDHAEVIVIANNFRYSGTNGIRAFENRNDDWMPTRSIWNQHAYHIDNVNDDGSIPQYEAPSWQSHNTYRLNTFPNRNVLQQADLTVSKLALTDNGFGQQPSLSVRAGNGGLLTPERSVTVAFYQGDPDAGGVLLGTVNAGSLAGGDYRDVALDNVQLPNSDDIYAVIDPDGTIGECDESNNRTSLPLQNAVVPGSLQVAVDAPEYGPDSPVLLSAAVDNGGALLASYQVTLRIEDAAGQSVAEFPQAWLTDLLGGASGTLADTWNTAGFLAGSYRLHGYLYDAFGQLLDEDTAAFDIVSGTASLDGSVSTGKAVYAAWDSVVIDARVENVTANAIQPPSVVEIAVAAPDGQPLSSQSAALGELLPGALRSLQFGLNLADAAAGNYPVTMTVKDAAGGAVLLVRSTSFTVERQALQALTGQVSAAPLQIYPGDPLQCSETVSNLSASPLPGVTLTSQLARAEDNVVLQSASRSVDFAPYGTDNAVYSPSTAGLAAGLHACILNAEVGGQNQQLGAALFDVLEPPVRIDAVLEAGEHGRVLVLLDSGDGNDPLGPNHNPSLDVQRATLEKLLSDAGWSYTIATDADGFTAELRSGHYVAYLLLSESVKLDESVQQELREAVNRGEGLIEAGGHDQRQGRIDEALGLKFNGKHPHMTGVQFDVGGFTPEGRAALQLTDRTLKFELDGAAARGRFEEDGAATDELALAEHAYGLGLAVHAGYDLLAEASLISADPRHGQLILDALSHIHPEELEPLAHRAYPLHVALTNQGIATPGRVVLTLPDNVAIADAGGAAIDGQRLTWSFDLTESATAEFTAWIILPETPVTVTAVIESGSDGNYTTQSEPALTIEPQSADDLQAALDAVAPLGDKAYKQARNYLQSADVHEQAEDWEQALDDLRRAADALIPIGTETAAAIRLDTDRALRTAAMKIPAT